MLLGEVCRDERDNGHRSDVETVGKWMANEKVLKATSTPTKESL